tara:strand:- start:259 stop:633 length:375 start_codon:yes stop_codon:yes gene_type:complete
MSYFDNNKTAEIFKRLTIFITVIIIFTFVIDLLKLDNHFYGLNSETSFMETLYYVSLSFSGMGYGGIYAQTSVSRLIMVILSVVKILLIIDIFSLMSDEKDIKDKALELLTEKLNESKLAILDK